MIRFFKKISTMAAVSLTLAVGFVSTANSETTLSARNAYSLCTTEDMDWINFCNGLIQGYADYASLSGNACFPTGTTRTTLITIYIDRLPSSQAYNNNESALVAAVEILSRAYACRG